MLHCFIPIFAKSLLHGSLIKIKVNVQFMSKFRFGVKVIVQVSDEMKVVVETVINVQDSG